VSVKKVRLEDLNPLDYNPRKITKKRFDRLVSSVREHTRALSGWNPKDGYRFAGTITVNKNGNRVVGGHARLDALRKLGQDWIHAEDITWVDLDPDSSEEKALCISLNDDASGGMWDEEKKLSLLQKIREDQEALFDVLDFSALTKKLKSDVERVSDEVDEEKEKVSERKIHLIDNTSFVLQEILSKFGDTADRGFLFFAYKNRLHLIVQCEEDTYEMTKLVAELLKRDNAEMNEFVLNAFRLGIEHSKWDEEDIEAAQQEYIPGELQDAVTVSGDDTDDDT
jgi:hypothetical protein